MKTFYIFKLNREYNLLAKKTPYNLFILLNTIYRHNKNDLLVAYDLFSEICMPINKCFFDEYIYEKLESDEYYSKFKYIHMYHDYLNNEESKMIISNSHIKIKSNKSNNIFINNLLDINSLFICDFKNNYYKLGSIKNNTKVK